MSLGKFTFIGLISAAEFRGRFFLVLSLRLCVAAVILAAVAQAQGLPVAPPPTVGMNAAKLNRIDSLVEQDI
jgi:hypothetical protein